MPDQSSSQDIVRRRQQREFAGRQAELAAFQKFLDSPPDDATYRIVMSIEGNGGVGKSWLLQRMQQVAENLGALTAYVDESQKDLPATLDHIANQLEPRGVSLKGFRTRYRTYLQHIQKIEADPETPKGLPELLGQLAVRAAFVAGDLVPGLRKGLDYLPQDKLETQAGEWFSYLVRKLTNKDEVSLVLDPVKVLSPLFVTDISGIRTDERQVIFFLDTYEKTGEYLDAWLRALLKGQYGIWPHNVRLVIAGREGPKRSQWIDLWNLVDYHRLSPFSVEEARDYLTQKGITDPDIVNEILRLSQRLPLLVATLATQSPEDSNRLGEPTGDAIERFLKWVEDPQRRDVALSAALPRRLNRDILVTLVDKEQAGPMFDWLSHMPFVEASREGWVYHDFVRNLMLRYKRREAPMSWSELHEKLANHFERMIGILGLESGQRFENSDGQTNALESGYHRLCQAYPRYIDGLLNDFVMAVLVQTAFAHAWADMIAQAEYELDIDPKKRWGSQLAEGLHAFDEQRYRQASQMFTLLLNRAKLESSTRVAVLGRRGLTHRLEGNYKAALTDLNEAISLLPTDVWALIQRGETYRQQGDFEKALSDYERAIQIEPGNTWAMVLTAEAYRQSGRFEQALSEFQKAAEQDPESAWIVVLQSETLRQIGKFQEALAGFDRAVALAPNDVFAITHRGEAYRLLGQIENALADFNRALELDPKFTWARVLRGETLRQLGRPQDAIVDLSYAIDLAPKDPWPIVLRGEAYRQSGQTQSALQDYARAIELKPDYAWAITLRGETRRQNEEFEAALTDFERALQIEPENVWALALRGETHRQMGNIEAALSDINHGLQRETHSTWLLNLRSQVYRDLGQYDSALADNTRAVEIQPDDALSLAHRGETYREMNRFDQALADLSRSLELAPDDGWTWARRAEAYRQMGDYKQSMHDFNRALDLRPRDRWAAERRQKLYDALGFHEGAWKAIYKDRLLEIYYEEGEYKSQYAALHLNDSYFRMVYGPGSDWGTSVILLPVYWSREKLYHGGQVYAKPHIEGRDLVLDLEGNVGDLHVRSQISLKPPWKSSILARVKVQVNGEVDLDDRPMEAFKPVMLSSMHISPEVWDTKYAYVGERRYEIPNKGWIIEPPVSGRRFELRGGRSEWKENAPTIIIDMDRPLQITGWVTLSNERNDDNVGFWAASEKLLTAWEYTIQTLKA